jgi:hypothetical protein
MCFSMDVSMVHIPQPAIGSDDDNQFGNELSWADTVHFGNLEFVIDRFDNLSFSTEGNDLCTIFMGMAHNESPSLHAILEESTNEDDSTSSDGESSGFPISRGCNVVTPPVPIATTPLPKCPLTCLTIPTVSHQTAVPQPDIKLLPKRLRAYHSITLGFKIKTRCSSYVCLGSSCHT